MLTEYRYVGEHADSLDGGKAVGPGDFTGPIDPELPQNAHLIEEGWLIEAAEGSGESDKLTGDALDKRARELHIEGRSSMSADELRDAVSNAEVNNEQEGDEG